MMDVNTLLARLLLDGPHLSDETLAAYLGGSVSGSKRKAIDEHLADCASCRREVAELSAAVARDDAALGYPPRNGHLKLVSSVPAETAAASRGSPGQIAGGGLRRRLRAAADTDTLDTAPNHAASRLNEYARFLHNRGPILLLIEGDGFLVRLPNKAASKAIILGKDYDLEQTDEPGLFHVPGLHRGQVDRARRYARDYPESVCVDWR